MKKIIFIISILFLFNACSNIKKDSEKAVVYNNQENGPEVEFISFRGPEFKFSYYNGYGADVINLDLAKYSFTKKHLGDTVEVTAYFTEYDKKNNGKKSEIILPSSCVEYNFSGYAMGVKSAFTSTVESKKFLNAVLDSDYMFISYKFKTSDGNLVKTIDTEAVNLEEAKKSVKKYINNRGE